MPLYPIIRRKRVVRGEERLRSRRPVPQVLLKDNGAVFEAAKETGTPAELPPALPAVVPKVRGRPFQNKP